MPVFYRIALTNPPSVDDFLSDKARGEPPPPDPNHYHLWDGISVFNTETQARNKGRDYPFLGSFIAQLDIPDNAPVRWARTLRTPGHHSVWGDPTYLLGCVARIALV